MSVKTFFLFSFLPRSNLANNYRTYCRSDSATLNIHTNYTQHKLTINNLKRDLFSVSMYLFECLLTMK